MHGFSNIVPPSVLISPRARMVYKFAAIGTKLLLLTVAALMIFAVDVPVPIEVLIGAVFFFGAFSVATLVLGMEYYWFKFDESGGWKKTFWFLALIFIPVGSIIYFYAVYLPQTKMAAAEESTAVGAGR
jgi:hypothetical protein